MSTHTPNPQHQPHDDTPVDFVMDDLVRQTLELEAFEREACAAPVPLRMQSPVVQAGGSRRKLALWLGSGLAAAAAVTLAVIMLPPSKPAGTNGTLAHNGGNHGARASDVAEPTTTVAARDEADAASAVIRTVSQPVRDDDLQQFAYLDPDIATGLPSLASERSVVLAVYQGDAPQDCDCIAWSVEQPGDWDTAKGNVLEQALRQPCMREASALTLVKITGPRMLLPFHDDDARELARCVPSSNCDEACAFQAASECVPSDVRVQTRTIEWAAR